MISLVAGLLLVPLVLRLVGPAPYGVWLFLSALASYLNYSDLGVGSAVVHFGSRSRSGAEAHTVRGLVRAAVAWSTIALVVALPAYLLVSASYLSRPDAERAVRPEDGSVLLVLGAVMTAGVALKPFGSGLIGSGRLPLERMHQSVGVLVRVIGTLLGCVLLQDIRIVALSEVCAVIVPNLLSAVRFIGADRPGAKTEIPVLRTMKYMLSYSTRAFGVSAVGALILQSGTIVLGAVGTPSGVSYFNAAFRIYSSVRQLVTWVTDPIRSALSRLHAVSAADATAVMHGISYLALWLSSAGCSVLIIIAPALVPLWLGREAPVDAIVLTLAVLLAGLVLNVIHIPLAPAGDAAGKPGVFFWCQFAWLVIEIPLALPLASKLGELGMALALTLPLVVVEPLYLLTARTFLSLSLKRYAARVLLPVALPLAGGLVAGLGASFGFRWLDSTGITLAGAGAFVTVFATLSLTRLSRPSWGNVNIALKERL